MDFVELSDYDDPRLDVYRDLPRSNLTRHSGRFIAESPLLVERLLESHLTTESILCGRRYCDSLRRWEHRPITVLVVDDELISQIVGFQFHRGMLACGLRPDNPTLDELVATTSGTSILVVCPHVVDPTNLAAVIRNANALGALGLLLGPHCADPFSRRVARVTMGTVLRLPIRTSLNLHDDLQRLRTEYAYWRVATVLDENAVALPSVKRPARLAILFGNEGHGLDAETIAACDERVTLPMHRGTDSLNLGTSTGVFLYHYAYVAKMAEPAEEA